MGRPTKKEQAMKMLEELGIKLEDLVEIPKPEIIEVPVQIKNENKEEESVRPEIDDNVRIEVRNNCEGTLVMKTKGTNLHKLLNGYGATGRIRFADLEAFYGEYPKAIREGVLGIKRVVTKGITVDEVIEEMGLDDIYLDGDKVSPNDIELLFTDKVDTSKFNSLITNTPDMADTVLEVGYHMWKEGRFNDNAKINILKQLFRNPQLFT